MKDFDFQSTIISTSWSGCKKILYWRFEDGELLDTIDQLKSLNWAGNDPAAD